MGIIVPVLTFVFLLFTKVSHVAPRLIPVGGSPHSWKVPDFPNNTLNQWAEKNRFKVGDLLVWKYDKRVDSVLVVTNEDYESCNTTKPLEKYEDGHTKFELEKSGAYFFISGAPGNCAKGEKFTLVVLSDRKQGDGGCNPKVSPVSPAPAPANTAVGLNVGSGLFLIAVAIVLAMA